MTVKELMDALENFDPNMEVKFSYNFGDYWNTKVASEVADIDEGQIKYSSYHRMYKVDDNEDYDNTKTVVIIS